MEENLIKTYSGVFLNNQLLFTGDMPQMLEPIRLKALEDFNSLGIPSTKLERYRYTDLLPAFNKKYDFYLKPDQLNFRIEEVFQCDVPQLDMKEVVTVNGFYYQNNSLKGWQPNGTYIGSLRKAMIEVPEVVSQYLNQTYASTDGLLSLNSLLFLDGLFIYVPKNKSLEFPLQLINLLIANNDLFSTQRNLIVLEENASANLVVCDHTLSSVDFLTNHSTEIFAGRNANLSVTMLQNVNNQATHITTTNIHQAHDSRVHTVVLTLHGGTVRNNFNVKLLGEGADNQTHGLYLPDGVQKIDNSVFIEHQAPHCTSNQLFKGILDDKSHAAFTGRIYVSRDAQKTSAYQKCSSLLLTQEAKVNARPQLEIYADDVKCTHGATAGHVNDEAMFYLRSRGISAKEAQFLLMFAFAYEVTQFIPLGDLRFRMEELINKRLRKELGRCHNCQISLS
ncbi:MAG: Fe-S cluster assembly protein SufD [Bacteroidales bacterium]|nr:Fe-S cluster assembly protein SufD [Bacteroidales bacterium]